MLGNVAPQDRFGKAKRGIFGQKTFVCRIFFDFRPDNGILTPLAESTCARLAELADAKDLGSFAARLAGSSPAPRTIPKTKWLWFLSCSAARTFVDGLPRLRHGSSSLRRQVGSLLVKSRAAYHFFALHFGESRALLVVHSVEYACTLPRSLPLQNATFAQTASQNGSAASLRLCVQKTGGNCFAKRGGKKRGFCPAPSARSSLAKRDLRSNCFAKWFGGFAPIVCAKDGWKLLRKKGGKKRGFCRAFGTALRRYGDGASSSFRVFRATTSPAAAASRKSAMPCSGSASQPSPRSLQMPMQLFPEGCFA